MYFRVIVEFWIQVQKQLQSTMDKFLRFEFFKSRGFATKASGMHFLERLGLRTVMEQYALEIEEFKEKKIMDFENIFDKHEEEKRIYILQEKEAIRGKRDEKKELLKKSMKDSMREEILQELAQEREEQIRNELVTKYNMFIPNVCDVNFEEIKEHFIQISRNMSENKLVLEPEQKCKLQAMAAQTTQIAIALQMIKSELQTFS